MIEKRLELNDWSVFHMALCVACFYCCIDSGKALINDDERQDRDLHVGLCRLIVGTHPRRFWNFFSLNLCTLL